MLMLMAPNIHQSQRACFNLPTLTAVFPSSSCPLLLATENRLLALGWPVIIMLCGRDLGCTASGETLVGEIMLCGRRVASGVAGGEAAPEAAITDIVRLRSSERNHARPR